MCPEPPAFIDAHRDAQESHQPHSAAELQKGQKKVAPGYGPHNGADRVPRVDASCCASANRPVAIYQSHCQWIGGPEEGGAWDYYGRRYGDGKAASEAGW